ncbi:MAG: 2OG-Fe(II) oxygenase family protein [Halieaceae bacterium]|jgi:isopenicillin N synthase-like dioxygenase|nr:2OG-Fe(II) oxygenase family protein [Halieaceae bacterium]
MNIPEVDFSPYDEGDDAALVALAAQFNEALTGVGFLSLRNIGIDESLRDRVFEASKAFFAQPEAEKRKLGYSDAEDNFGYQGICEESLMPGSAPDLKEAMTLRDLHKPRDFHWPDTAFRDLLMAFHDDCLAAAYRILRVFATDLQMDREFFVEKHGGENVTMRILHYPPLPQQSEQQLGAGPHTDYGMVTLLFQDLTGGLEVLDRDGQWQPVTPRPGAVVINAGDMLERWTNKRYRSSLHRVRARPGGSDRYSIAFFVDPDSDTLVECLPSCTDAEHPPLFGPTSAGEHILAKIQATHI